MMEKTNNFWMAVLSAFWSCLLVVGLLCLSESEPIIQKDDALNKRIDSLEVGISRLRVYSDSIRVRSTRIEAEQLRVNVIVAQNKKIVNDLKYRRNENITTIDTMAIGSQLSFLSNY